MTIQGQDWSGYQGKQPSVAGIDFAFVKATQSTTYINPDHADQVAWARKNKLVVGHYHFLVTGNIQGQAEYFVQHAAPKAGEVLACDWETNPATDTAPTNAEKDKFIRAVKVLKPSLKMMLYTGQNFWLTKDNTSYVGDGLWIAQYNGKPGKPDIKAAWLIHQYTSTPLDKNVAQFESRSAMAAWAAGEKDPVTEPAAFTQVWKTDDSLPAGSTEKNPDNKFWTAQTYLTGTFENTVQALAQVRTNGSGISALSSQLVALSAKVDKIVVGGVDLDLLASKVADLLATRLKS